MHNPSVPSHIRTAYENLSATQNALLASHTDDKAGNAAKRVSLVDIGADKLIEALNKKDKRKATPIAAAITELKAAPSVAAEEIHEYDDGKIIARLC